MHYHTGSEDTQGGPGGSRSPICQAVSGGSGPAKVSPMSLSKCPIRMSLVSSMVRNVLNRHYFKLKVHRGGFISVNETLVGSPPETT